MPTQVGRQVVHGPIEVVDGRQELPDQILSGSLAIVNSVAVDAAFVVEEVGPFTLQLLQARVVLILVLRGAA
jgi:hypothetical protein